MSRKAKSPQFKIVQVDGKRHLKLREGWSILSGQTGLYYHSFARTRREAIQDHEQAVGRPWAYCQKHRLDVVIRTAIFSVHP